MIKNKKIICIIPALEKNTYSEKGDLVSWGDTTLLEWKLSQVKDLNFKKEIFVIANSKKITKICKKYNVKVLNRKKNLQLSELHKFVGKKFKNKLTLWLNTTSPFLSSKIIGKFVKNYQKKSKKYDSAFTYLELQEYFFKEKKPVNFTPANPAVSRRDLVPLQQVAGSLYLVPSKHLEKTGSLFGKKPLMIKLDWFSSLEIKSISDLENFKFLISKYFKK